MMPFKINRPVIAHPIIFSLVLISLSQSFCELSLNLDGSQFLPEDRKIEWAPGIQTGIPNYPVSINVKKGPYNAKGDGVTDDTAAIQRAIANCPSKTAIYLPAGTYRVTACLDVYNPTYNRDNKNIAIRGDGPDKTFIRSEGTSGAIVAFGGYGEVASSHVISGYKKGSQAITVDKDPGYSPGDVLTISQDNDPSITENMPGYCVRAVAQKFLLVSKDGNTLHINRPLYFTYNPAMNIRITMSSGIHNAGIEDLCVERVAGFAGGSHNIFLDSAANCWVKNVKSLGVRKWHVRLSECYGCEVRGSYFLEAALYGGDEGYGVGCFMKCTDNLIEDNVFYKLRHSMIIEYGGQGNVFGYNYSQDPYLGPGTNWLSHDAEIHGGHPMFNLFEGNICAQLAPESYLGSSSHNVFFRNYATAKGAGCLYNLYAVRNEWGNLYESYICNILVDPTGKGTAWFPLGDSSGGRVDPRVAATVLRHANYDSQTKITDTHDSLSGKSIPSSLYLKAKPAFYGILDEWPSIGSDLSPMVKDLPAKKRFDDQLEPKKLM